MIGQEKDRGIEIGVEAKKETWVLKHVEFGYKVEGKTVLCVGFEEVKTRSLNLQQGRCRF